MVNPRNPGTGSCHILCLFSHFSKKTKSFLTLDVFIFFFFLTGVYLLYNVAMVPTAEQSGSATCMSIFPPSWTSHQPPHQSHPLSHRKAPSWALCATQQLLTRNLHYTWYCIYINATLSLPPTLLFPRCVHKPVFYICISIPALQNRFICTLFLDSIYMH